MAATAYAIIIAGGNGERFWPVSTPERPKQFVDLFGGKPLIRHALDRLEGLIPPERTLVVTARRFVAQTRRALPSVPPGNIFAEPCRRDTAAAVAVAVGLVKRLGGPEAVGCILTADHVMEPAAKFRRALRDAIRVAAKKDAIVTMGIVPSTPATGFGYIRRGETVTTGTKTVFHRVDRFVEKPDLATARDFLSSGDYFWNAGMFVWTARVMEAAFVAHAPDIGALVGTVSAAKDVSAALRRAYPPLRATSVDYAVMEHADNILVAESDFDWDDVGSWESIPRHFPSDPQGNACLGDPLLVDTSDSIVVSDRGRVTAVLGLKDVVVVQTRKATLVCSRDRVQELRRIVARLGTRPKRPGK